MVLKYSPWCKPKVSVVQSVMLHRADRSQARTPERRRLQDRLPYARPRSSSLPPVLKILTKTFNYKQSNASQAALPLWLNLVTNPTKTNPQKCKGKTVLLLMILPMVHPIQPRTPTHQKSVAQHNPLCRALVLPLWTHGWRVTHKGCTLLSVPKRGTPALESWLPPGCALGPCVPLLTDSAGSVRIAEVLQRMQISQGRVLLLKDQMGGSSVVRLHDLCIQMNKIPVSGKKALRIWTCSCKD